MIKGILSIALLWCALWAAMTIGVIWQSQYHPTPGAVVSVSGGGTEKGDSWRAWNGDWVLTQKDGAELRFRDSSRIVMISEANDDRGDLVWKWRSWIPLLIVVLVSTWCVLVRPFIKRFKS